MSDSTALYRAQENLRMMGTCPTWYDHLDSIEAAMAEQDRIYKIRTAAGWELDEGGWSAPHPETGELMPEWDWECEFGLSCPEDVK
mgnify:FL=1|jgi:hypothetical protein